MYTKCSFFYHAYLVQFMLGYGIIIFIFIFIIILIIMLIMMFMIKNMTRTDDDDKYHNYNGYDHYYNNYINFEPVILFNTIAITIINYSLLMRDDAQQDQMYVGQSDKLK